MEELGAGRIPSAGELKTSNRREAGQAIRFLRAEVPRRWWCSARSGGVGVGRTAGGASGCVLLMCYLAGQLSKLVAAPRNGALAALLQAARAFRQTPTNGRKRLIHRYPNWFERGCLGGAVAKYTRERDGSIKVVNRCRRKDGSWKTITGRATVVPGSGNARLKVRFFGPFAGDYWIVGWDEKNYSWSLVGHPSRRFLWILSRRPRITQGLYNEIVANAVRQGYSAEWIVPSPGSIRP